LLWREFNTVKADTIKTLLGCFESRKRQTMTEPIKTKHTEQRGVVVLSILFLASLLLQFPDRIRVLPSPFVYALVVVEVLPLIAVMSAPEKRIWLTVERIVTFGFCMVCCIIGLVDLAKIIGELLRHTDEANGLQLLVSGLGVWVNNVLSFSLLYWIVDRGGPAIRTKGTTRTPDWLFPQEGAPAEDYPVGWKPGYIDYLFLGFCTGAAFSPTDVLPLTHRAKLLMMLQSSISLLTIMVVLSRAVNILK